MRILIVDDEAPLRQSLSLLLAESGYRVEAEGNPVQALARAEAEAFDLILCDVRMPEMDGLEATRTIRAMDRKDAQEIPIIALTANAFDEDVQRSLQAGMNAHLSKPVEPDHLYQTLGELIYEAEAH